MTEIEWRRRWKPSLNALPWKPLKIDDDLYLIKFLIQGGSYEFMITSINPGESMGVWFESLDEDGLSERSKVSFGHKLFHVPLFCKYQTY